MPVEAINLVATRFKVLSEPLRLQILQQLEQGELGVTDLAASVGSTQPNVSKHLRIMQEAGIISRKQQSNTVFYSITDPSVFELCDLVCNSLKQKLEKDTALFR